MAAVTRIRFGLAASARSEFGPLPLAAILLILPAATQGCLQRGSHDDRGAAESVDHDFGVLYYSGWYGDQGFDARERTLKLSLRNNSPRPKRIIGVIASCACSDVRTSATTVPAGGSAVCQVRVRPRLRWGRQYASVSVQFHDGTVQDFSFSWAMYPRLTWLRPQQQPFVKLGQRNIYRAEFLTFGPSPEQLYATLADVEPAVPYVVARRPAVQVETGVFRQRLTVFFDLDYANIPGPRFETLALRFTGPGLPPMTRRIRLAWHVRAKLVARPSALLLPPAGETILHVTSLEKSGFTITGHLLNPSEWSTRLKVTIEDVSPWHKRLTLRRLSSDRMPAGSKALLVLQTDDADQPELRVTLVDYPEEGHD